MLISAIGLRLNISDHTGAVMGIYTVVRVTSTSYSLNAEGDADDVIDIVELVGLALLTMLNTLKDAGEPKPDSRFLDLPLVVGYYLEASHDLPEYGVEGKCVAWHKEVVKLSKGANLKVASHDGQTVELTRGRSQLHA